MRRASGILLHVSALPGPHGIGDLGPWVCKWIDFLAAGKQQYWQFLPLGPTGFGNSPYSSFSAFAGNPLLISLEELVKDELLKQAELGPGENNIGKVLFEKVKRYKLPHLLKAWTNFRESSTWKEEYERFCAQHPWLETFAAFMAPKEDCDPDFIRFQQFVFQRQVARLKLYASQKGVTLIGDLPMYVAGDSADLQEAPDLFDLQSGYSAGSPPSNAFPVGQKWGNPLYRWEKHRETNYRWWLARIQHQLTQVDIIRLDYFCGYAFFWAMNGSNGHWRRGPEVDLFERTRGALGQLPFIAEDLGELTPDVKNLRDRFNLPGMKVLHYAFDGNGDNPYLPHNFQTSNCVVYTGTHDNDTTCGWFNSSPEYVKQNARDYLHCDGRDISWDLIKLAAQSKADLMIVPYQDILCLGSEARFNTPGTCSVNNWAWRVQAAEINDKRVGALEWLAKSSHRG
jgi:4-alpha-glucanotransferase